MYNDGDDDIDTGDDEGSNDNDEDAHTEDSELMLMKETMMKVMMLMMNIVVMMMIIINDYNDQMCCSQKELSDIGLSSGDSVVISAENKPLISLATGFLQLVTDHRVTLVTDRYLFHLKNWFPLSGILQHNYK